MPGSITRHHRGIAAQSAAAGPSEVDELIDSKNILLAGTSMVSGQAKAVVFATGMHTEFGKIAHLTQTAGGGLTVAEGDRALEPLDRNARGVIGLLFFAIGWVIGIPFWEVFIFAIGIIVAMVPEGLAPHADLGARARHPAHGKTQRSHPLSALGRDARFHDGHLHR